MSNEDLTDIIIGAAIAVHRELGPGLYESIYEPCLCYELDQLGISYERQVSVPIKYKGIDFEHGYRLDILVDKRVIIELKSVLTIEPIHVAQILTYMKMMDVKTGLIMNFNVKLLKDGLKRVSI